MASTVDRRDQSSRRSGHTRSRSPARERVSPPRKHSPSARRERSHAERSGSPRRRSPVKASLSHREMSPQREKAKERVRSPKHARSPSPAGKRQSRSLSPRSKRLRRAQAEREGADVTEGDRRRPPSSEDRGTRKHRERAEGASRDRKVEPKDDRSAFTGRRLDDDDDDGRGHSRDRRTDRDDRSGASREARSGRDGDRHDSRGKRSDPDRKGGSREQRTDQSSRRDSVRDRMADRDENNGGSGRSSRRGRSGSPEEHRHRGRHESHTSPRASRSAAHREDTSSRVDVASRSGDADSLAMMNTAAEALEVKEKQKPSFELSGKLAEETNKVGGITLLYSEPPEARKSDIRWRLYVFKGGEALNEPLYVHRMSHYLFGRERRIADIPTDHPSCSKQHAVLQYRLVEKEQPDGMMSKQVRPYLMDLGSTNGTFINEDRIESHRYYELFERDNIKFGNSSREYVLLHENSTD
uniref:FHA domain-containing protein n=1 Tax=Aegilops tauschii subsp. strangulata TaxID=200361 RepID=A0A453Q4G9_AEGTS